MGQLAFQLLEIARKETWKKVKEALETARIYKHIGIVRRETKTTASYDPRLHGATNTISKPVENVATWNVDTEQRMKQITEDVEKAIRNLRKREREIIQKSYLDNETAGEFDYLLCQEFGMSERTYRRIRDRAFYSLAFMLNLEVMVWYVELQCPVCGKKWDAKQHGFRNEWYFVEDSDRCSGCGVIGIRTS